MKKFKLHLAILVLIGINLASCKKEIPGSGTENNAEAFPSSSGKTNESIIGKVKMTTVEPSSTVEEFGEPSASRCTTMIQAVGLAYLIQPLGPFGASLSFDVTYSNTAPNGYFNLYLRKPGQLPTPLVWKAIHVVPALTGTGFDVLHYNVTVPQSFSFPLELAVQGAPGTSGCPTITKIFQIN